MCGYRMRQGGPLMLVALILPCVAVSVYGLEDDVKVTTLQPDAKWPLHVRVVSEDELKAKCSPEENTLRLKVLDVVITRQDIAIVRDLLNKPWNKESVGVLVDLALRSIDDVHLTSRVLDLLAHVAAANPKGDVESYVIEGFDRVFKEIGKNPESPTHVWAFALNAIERHGSAALFTTSFWAVYEKSPIYASNALHKQGDKTVLLKLQDIRARGIFMKGSEELARLERDILVIAVELLRPELRQERWIDRRVEAALEFKKRNPDLFDASSSANPAGKK